jgi:HAD superfamily hydrolase (TIGR01549 family)/HAD superfamily hydrolase (TIGR01509 family)
MELKAVLFDMGGTIDTFRFSKEQRISNIHFIRESFQRIGITLSQNDEELADSITNGAAAYLRWNMETHIELKPEEIWSAFFLKETGISKETMEPIAEDLAFFYETKLFERELKPGIPQVLEQIKKMGLIIGCISNTQGLRQVPYSLKQYGISEYFEPVVLSSAYGRRKPDPSIFYYAARLANVPTGACIYVGDKINRDILGAKSAGYRLAVQIKHRYDNGEKDEGPVPDAIIRDMQELIPILQKELKKDRETININNDRKIKALFFDAGDVLYYRPNRHTNFKKFLEGKEISQEPDFETQKQIIKDLAFSGKMKRHDYYEQVIRLYGILSQDEVAEGVKALSLDDNTVEIMEGVPETILKLKEMQYLLGIITDTAFIFSRKLSWFKNFGFGHVWDCVISSKEIGIRKPAPVMYEKALEQTGLKPHEALFVGHKKSELDGAKSVGLTTVAYNYDEDVKADYYLHNFSDLLSLSVLDQRYPEQEK